MFKRSDVHSDTVYFCWFGKRYIFEQGKYRGWYKPKNNSEI